MARDRNDLKTLNLMFTDDDWEVPQIFPDLTDSSAIAVDLETRDPNIKTRGPGWPTQDGNIVGIAIAAGDFCGYYPIAHQGGGNLNKDVVMRWVKKQLATPGIPKIMHNATYDAGWLQTEGVDVQGRIIDTMIAAPLIDENRFSYSLNAVSKTYLGMSKNESSLQDAAEQFGFDAKADLWRMPSRFVGKYAEQDALLTLKLWERLKVEIDAQELTAIFDLETSLIPILIEMRRKGVRIDCDEAERSQKLLVDRKKELLAEIKHDTGLEVEFWAAASVAKVFDHYNLSYPKTTGKNPQPSFTKAFLNDHPHPVAQKIVRLRELDKASGAFIQNLLEFQHKGRIHAEFHPLRSDDGGTVTGRFSSSNPNLQQMPARNPETKKLIRGIFQPEEGELWGSFDYSSQEPRLLVHYCAALSDGHRHPKIDTIVEEFHKGDVDFHQMVADMAGVSRKDAKTVNLGIMYGMGVGKLSNVLGISQDEAKTFLAEYNSRVPFVKGLADLASRIAQQNGQVRTVLGRRCRFDMWEPKSYGYNRPLPWEEAQRKYGGQGMIRRAFTYKALNRLIQGSAADQTKKAMVECHERGHTPMLQVHDELCFSVGDEAAAQEIAQTMETCVDLLIPSKVDVALGQTWGDVD